MSNPRDLLAAGEVRLAPESVEALARRLAELLAPSQPAGPRRLLTAAEVSDWWGVERSWVYAHADDLGARRLGAGPRPRLRFDPDDVAERLGDATPPRIADERHRCIPSRAIRLACTAGQSYRRPAREDGRAARQRPRPRRRSSGLRHADQPTPDRAHPGPGMGVCARPGHRLAARPTEVIADGD